MDMTTTSYIHSDMRLNYASSAMLLDTFSLDDVDGNGNAAQNGVADTDCYAAVHTNVDTFVSINTFLSGD